MSVVRRDHRTTGPRDHRTLPALRSVVALCACLLAVGCTSTVVPKPISSTVASWDGGQQNSGLIGKDNKAGYFLVTEHWRERYNGLVERYGKYYVPPLKQDEGITPTETNGVYRVDGQRVGKFIQMGWWFKEGREAVGR